MGTVNRKNALRSIQQRRTARPWLALAGLLFASVSYASSDTQVTPVAPAQGPQYFSDCAHLLFDNRNRDVLTRQERVFLLDGQVKANLNNYESCIQQAMNASRERVSATAASANLAAAGATAEHGADEARSEDEQDQTSEESIATPVQTMPPTSPSRQHQQGNRQQGSSSVCDAIKSGLENASTESEKTHFAALAKEYNC